MNHPFRTVLITLAVLILSACTQSVTPTGNLLDGKGGTVKSSDGRASLVVAAQALSAPVSLTLTPSNQTSKPSSNKVLVSGTAYSLSSTPVTTLSKPATLTLKYDPTLVQGLSKRLGVKTQAAANTLEIARLANNTWEVVSGSTANETDSTVQVAVSEMGTYAILAPDGSKPVWQLEVKGGVGVVDSTIAQIGILSQTINRNFLYIGLTRNGEAPTTPVALHLDGPSGYSGDLTFSAGNAWGVYALSTRQAGTFTVKFTGDGQELNVPVDIALTPTLALPAITSQVTASTAAVSWAAIDGAQSYEVRLYNSGLDILQTTRTKNSTASLTIPAGYSSSSLAVAVLAYGWDATLERSQKYPGPPNVFNVSAGIRGLSSSPNTNTPRLSGPDPQGLSLITTTSKSTSGSVSIYNSGNLPLSYSATVSGSAFQISGNPAGTLASSNSAQINIQGTCPATVGSQTGTLNISSNDPDRPTVAVGLQLDCVRPLTSSLMFSRISHSSNPILTQWSPDGNSLATLSPNDGRVIVWNTNTGAIRKVFMVTRPSNYTSGGGFMAWSPNSQYLAATSQASSAQIWNISSGQNVISLEGLSGFSSLAWRPDGTQIAALNSGTSDVAVFNVSTGSILKQFNAKGNSYWPPSYLAWAASNRIVTGSRLTSTSMFPNTVGVWNLDTNPVSLTTSYTYNSNVAVGQGGSQIVGIVQDTTDYKLYLEVRQSTSGNLVRRMGPISTSSLAMIRDILFSGDGQRIGLITDSSGGSSSNPFKLEVWNAVTGAQVSVPTTIAGGEISGGSIDWDPTASQLAFPTRSAHIRLLSTGTNQTTRLLGYNTGYIAGVKLNNSNQMLSYSTYSYANSYATTTTGTLAWSNISTGQTLQALLMDNTSIANAAWRSNGNITLLTTNNILRSINGQTGAQITSVSLQDLPTPSNTGGKSVFSPDGSKLLTSTASR